MSRDEIEHDVKHSSVGVFVQQDVDKSGYFLCS